MGSISRTPLPKIAYVHALLHIVCLLLMTFCKNFFKAFKLFFLYTHFPSLLQPPIRKRKVECSHPSRDRPKS